MNAARDHSRFDELAVGSALYALEPDDEQSLAEHLPTCSRCQQTQRDSQESLAILAAGLDGPMPPARVLDRIHEAIGAPHTSRQRGPVLPEVAEPVRDVEQPIAAEVIEHHVQQAPLTPTRKHPDEVDDHSRPESAAGPRARHRQGPGRGPRRTLRLRRLTEVAAALVLVIAVGVGFTGYFHLRTQSDRANQVAAERSTTIQQLVRDSSVATLADANGGKTVGYVVNQNGKLEVVSDGLSVNDSQTSEYALWSVSGAGASPKLVGTFDVRQGDLGVQSVASLPTGFGNVTAMAVSKEPGRERPTTPTTVVASGVVT